MSINSLTDLELMRQPSAMVEAIPQAAAQAATADANAEVPPLPKSQVGSALELLTKYIPTEVITLYVAAVSATQVLANNQIVTIVYWAAAALTPVFLVLVLMNKRVAAGESPLPKPWPWWRMTAATIAFMVWALAVPGKPLHHHRCFARSGGIWRHLHLYDLEPA